MAQLVFGPLVSASHEDQVEVPLEPACEEGPQRGGSMTGRVELFLLTLGYLSMCRACTLVPNGYNYRIYFGLSKLFSFSYCPVAHTTTSKVWQNRA